MLSFWDIRETVDMEKKNLTFHGEIKTKKQIGSVIIKAENGCDSSLQEKPWTHNRELSVDSHEKPTL